jgi:hypothetical protein
MENYHHVLAAEHIGAHCSSERGQRTDVGMRVFLS